MKSLLFCLFLLLSSTFVAFAQEEDINEETVTETASTNQTAEVILIAAPGVSTSFVFPTSPTKQIAIGRDIEVIIGFHNEGSSTFNVSQIFGALRYPQDWRYYIQNFTKQASNVVVKPGEQHSFVYTFMPDNFLESREIGFSGQFFYSDLEGNNYTSYWYNSTISLIEVQEPLDLQTLFTYIGLVGVAGLVLFIIYKSVSDKKSRKPARRVETGTVATNVIDGEWLEGTHANLKAPKQRSPSPKGSRKVKST